MRLVTICLLFLFTTGMSYGQQVTFSGWSNFITNVTDYAGKVERDAFRLKFNYLGSNLNLPGWKLSVKLVGPVRATDGTVFPEGKVSLVPTRTEGPIYPLPTIAQIGMPSPVTLVGTSELFLVPSSNVAMNSSGNFIYDLGLYFDLVVAGGAYLAPLQMKTFTVNLRFTAYRQDNRLIGVWNEYYMITISNLWGSPPVENRYSIQLSTEAADGLLEFRSKEDYMNGKSITYTNGLTVSATTDFQVTVRSVSAHFSSPTGRNLPLDIVHLQVTGGAATTYSRPLSTATQTILEGTSTNGTPVAFDINYTTPANDSRLFNIPAQKYGASLMYEITPR